MLAAADASPKAVQLHLGHSSITVTMDRYTHLFPSDIDALIRRLDDIRLLVGRSFVAQTTDGLDCGHISTDAGGSFVYGWSVFIRTMGVDVGDIVRSTFDLLEGVATLELGGSELIDR